MKTWDVAIETCDKIVTEQLSMFGPPKREEPKNELKEYTVKYNTKSSYSTYIMVVKAYSEKQAISYATQLLHKQGIHNPLNMRVE